MDILFLIVLKKICCTFFFFFPTYSFHRQCSCRSPDESKAANWCFVSPITILSFPVRLMNDWMIDFPTWCGTWTHGWFDTRGIALHGSRGRSLRNAAPEDCNQRRRLSHSVAAANQILVRADFLTQNVLNYFWLKVKGRKIKSGHQGYFFFLHRWSSNLELLFF